MSCFQSQNSFVKTYYPIFSLYAAVTSWKKSKNLIDGFALKLKNSFCTSFFSKNFTVRFFSTKIIGVNFRPLCYCNFWQKIRKVSCISFHKASHCGCLFWASSDPNTFPKNIFPKTLLCSISSLSAAIP